VSGPQIGAIAVMDGRGGGHVALVSASTPVRIDCVSGNNGNRF